jgi:uncharacterized membrane protein
MPVIDQSVIIARPAAEVLDFLVRAENLPRWDSSVVECVQLDAAPVTVGTRYRGASKILGRRVEWTVELTDFVPGRKSESTSVDGQSAFTVSYDLSAVSDGTRLRYRLAADSGFGGAFGRAMEPLIEKAQTNVVKANLATLVRLLDPQPD